MKQLALGFLLIASLISLGLASSSGRRGGGTFSDEKVSAHDARVLAIAGEHAIKPGDPPDSVKMLTKPELAEVQQLLLKLKCGTCHIESEGGKEGDMFSWTFARMSRSMNAGKVADYKAFLLDPQKGKPGVNMPSFWGTPTVGQIVPIREKLLATPDSQADAIARYIYLMTRIEGKQD